MSKKVLKVDYHHEGTDNTVLQSVIEINNVECIAGASQATPLGETEAKTLTNPLRVTYSVYSSLAACKSESKSPIYTGETFNNIPSNETAGYITQALNYLKDKFYKDANPSIVTA